MKRQRSATIFPASFRFAYDKKLLFHDFIDVLFFSMFGIYIAKRMHTRDFS